MSTDVWKALTQVSMRLAELTARDEELRAGVRALAAALAALADPPDEAATASPEPGSSSSPDDQREADTGSTGERASSPTSSSPASDGEPFDGSLEEPLPIEEAAAALTFAGGAEPARPAWQEYPTAPTEDDLRLISARCRLKAEGARWSAERERRRRAGADYQTEIAPTDREIIARARDVEGCYLWMNSPDWLAPDDLTLVDDTAGCFDVLADALDIVPETTDAIRREALNLVAEAQSAVWSAVSRLSSRTDFDQERTFIWVKEEAAALGHYIPRHMRRDDPADPTVWRERRERVDHFAAEAASQRDRSRQRRKLFGKLDYVSNQVATGQVDEDYGRQVFIDTAEELLALGVPPSNVDLCKRAAVCFDLSDGTDEVEAIAPAATPAFRQVLQEAARRRDAARFNGDDATNASAGAVSNGVADVDASVADVNDAVRRIEHEFPDAIAFAFNSRSGIQGNPFAEPDRLYAALRFLATTYRDARRGVAACPDLDAECRRQSGFWYRPHQSGTAVGMFAEDYQTNWNGRTLMLHSHLGKGISRDPRHTLRVAFDFDESQQLVVVGYIGQHQRTRST